MNYINLQDVDTWHLRLETVDYVRIYTDRVKKRFFWGVSVLSKKIKGWFV